MSRRVDVAKLLASLGIDARQRGDEWTALCPNPAHQDRHPSWRIVDDLSSDRHGLHKCYPCGFGGDAIELAKVVLGVGFHAALCWVDDCLAEDTDEPVEARVEVASPRVFRLPPGVLHGDVLGWPQPFRRYLAARGLTRSQVARWGLGYALEGRLAGRVVIPTRSATGRLLSYTARAIDRGGLRYLTPARDEGADAGAVFGEEHWGPGGGAVLSEGSFDALACERAVPELAVAVLGTGGADHAADPRVVAKLSRFDVLVVATDPDPAGDRAYESVAALLPGKRVCRARPPAGLDANAMDSRSLRGMILSSL